MGHTNNLVRKVLNSFFSYWTYRLSRSFSDDSFINVTKTSNLLTIVSASKRTCFSSGSNGQSIDKEFTRTSSLAFLSTSQSDAICALSKYFFKISKKPFCQNCLYLRREQGHYCKNPNLFEIIYKAFDPPFSF